MFFGSRDKFKSVTAAQLAALSAWKGIDVGDRVGAVIFNDTEIADYPPGKSQNSVMSILHKIVELNHQLNVENATETNEGMLNNALEKALRLCPHDTLIIIISDFSGADARTEKLTARIAAHNDVLGLLVHDPLRHSPTGQTIHVSDGSRQIELDLSDKRTSEALVHDYQKEQEVITKKLRRLSAPLLMISNEGDVVQQVRRLLGATGRV
jgi:uncharacterized protein (DUF58 family)